MAAAVLRLPGFLWSVVSDDEAIYDAMAQEIRAGGHMYSDVLDHKPPGLAYVYAWVQSAWAALLPHTEAMAGVHATGALVAAGTCWGLYQVGRRVLPAGTPAWPALLFATSSTSKCAFDGLAVNGELLMGLPTVLGVWALLWANASRGWRRASGDLLAGALVGAASLFKWQAAVVGLALPFFAALHLRAFVRRLAHRGPLWLVGFLLPLVLCAAHFHGHGLLAQAWRWGVMFNLQYVAEGPSALYALRRLLVQVLVVVLPAGVLYAFGTRALVRSPWPQGAWRRAAPGLRLWACLSALSVGVGGRFFGHYFLQLELPLCLLAAPGVAALYARRRAATLCALLVPTLAFAAFSASPQTVRHLLNGEDPDWQACGARVAAAGAPNATLFVWGNAPPIYHYAHRRMGTRFAFCNYLTGLSPGTPSEYDATVQPAGAQEPIWQALFDDLERRRPELLLDTAAGGWKGYGKFPLSAYPRLHAYVQAHYRKEGTIAGAVLYRRRP